MGNSSFKDTTLLFILLLLMGVKVQAHNLKVSSPDKTIEVHFSNSDSLSYYVSFKNQTILKPSVLGFEFKNEAPMQGDFEILNQEITEFNETWKPVVKSKHAQILNHYNELKIELKEKSGMFREMTLYIRVFNDGVGFRYKLSGISVIGNRKITKELTSFSVPDNPKTWSANYGRYVSAQEAEFIGGELNSIEAESIIGLPLLMQYNEACWVAITEANIDNYPGFYVGTNGEENHLTTKLSPLPGEKEDGVKVLFDDEIYTPWRVIMIGDNPGVLIESEIIQNLNEPCALEDTSWIKPGISAWDHWWSGGVKMEMPVINEYIDLASRMNWEYMLIDWQWYGTYKSPDSDITTEAEQLDIPEILQYAKDKNVRIILWLHSTDVNQNSAYKKAFALYHKWGVAGIKIDFMDRDDQEMVNWYLDIIKEAAKNELLVDFHGAYKPDGIIRTYPNMITREGVMGNEYNRFSKKPLTQTHLVNLVFTRMLAGQMDFTPGGFLNVHEDDYKKQSPALVKSTRSSELAKFVIYESPLTVACDHPDNYLNQPGEDFLKIVPTVWDDTKFLGGYPDEYIAMARKNSGEWFVGVLNNSIAKEVELNLDFLTVGTYQMEIWEDSKKSNKKPSELTKISKKVKAGDTIKVKLANNGGFVSVIKKIN